jgi:hypothetical protein
MADLDRGYRPARDPPLKTDADGLDLGEFRHEGGGVSRR